MAQTRIFIVADDGNLVKFYSRFRMFQEDGELSRKTGYKAMLYEYSRLMLLEVSRNHGTASTEVGTTHPIGNLMLGPKLVSPVPYLINPSPGMKILNGRNKRNNMLLRLFMKIINNAVSSLLSCCRLVFFIFLFLKESIACNKKG